MAKRRTYKAQPDMFANRVRGEITFGASAADAVYDHIKTGMNVGQLGAYKWVVLAAHIQPATDQGHVNLGDSSTFVQAQIAVGEQVLLEDQSDAKVVSHCRYSGDITGGAGMTAWPWPLRFPIHAPIPVFASNLSVLLQGTNIASMNATKWSYEIWYITRPISNNEITEYLAAFGEL